MNTNSATIPSIPRPASLTSLARGSRTADRCLGDQQVDMAMAAFSAGQVRFDHWRVRSISPRSGDSRPDDHPCPYCDRNGYAVTFTEQSAGVLMKAERAMCGVHAERFVSGWRAPGS
jgi:hypothetical protein